MQMDNYKTVFVTGGAGFIGSNFLSLVVPRFPSTLFINIDKLTYASNLLSLREIQYASNYSFEQLDIQDSYQVDSLFQKYMPDCVVHFAAESHVDRSIQSPRDFIETNITGTFNLLEAFRHFRSYSPYALFHHVSTDEVYGSLGDADKFTETHPYNPRSPYSASKAASDHLVKAYFTTYNLPVKITNCSNNYGPRQFPEKLIPLMILNALSGKDLPVYGSGRNIRDWLYVEDHCEAILKVIENGTPGETYNIGGNCEKSNLEVVEAICAAVSERTRRPLDQILKQIHYVADRPGHDWRYAMDTTKIKSELGWTPHESFESGLQKTVDWYLDHTEWVQSIQNKEYLNWITLNYSNR